MINSKPTRLRTMKAMRDLIRETRLSMDDIMYPIFVVEGKGIKNEISSMKNQFQLSVDKLESEIQALMDKGIKSLLIFGEPETKDEFGSSAFDKNGIVQKAIKEIKRVFPQMLVASDVCLCQYKSDGHCCFFDQNGRIKHQQSLEALCKTALSQAIAGADIIAPSDMMDDRVGAIRQTLDQNGFEHVAIMAYSAKFASNYYGPFRDAVNSAPSFGDRKSYQMDFCNAKEALKEMVLDLDQGADILMVKPAGVYLDIIRKGADRFDVPIAAYQVSGEYAMLYHAVEQGMLSKFAIYESLIAIKRSGAKIIITYFANQLQEILENIYE